LFSVLVAFAAARTVSYKGEQVLRCQLTEATSSHLPLLQDKLDVWGVHADRTADIRVKTSEERKLVESLLEDCAVTIDDLEEHISAREKEEQAKAADWFAEYHTYADLVSWYSNFSSTYRSLITGGSAGTTVLGTNMPWYRMSATSSPRFTIYMQCQIHAREWISGATCNYIWNQLVTDYNNNVSAVVNLLNNLQIILVPFTNPDGYMWTWTNDRMWRKNRNQDNRTCIGVDCNRNYNDHWGQGGSSTNPCSDTYMGPSVASEKEVQNTQNLFKAQQRIAPVIGGMDWHSYSQLVLRPYGWTNSLPPHDARLTQLGDNFAAAIRAVHGKVYVSQRSYQLYQTTGSASDWFFGSDAYAGNGGYRAAGFTVELRPSDSQSTIGFQLPPVEIIPTGQENYAALVPWITSLLTTPIQG